MAYELHNKQARILVLMGSDSDWDTMKKCVATLDDFGVPCEVRVASAHRTPEKAATLASGAREWGIGVIICAAGLAAHLAGSISAKTTLPVIGVPMAAGPLNGQDALLATVMMPPGIPVATVGIGAAKNAALLAIQILAVSDAELAGKLAAEKEKMVAGVDSADDKLQKKRND